MVELKLKESKYVRKRYLEESGEEPGEETPKEHNKYLNDVFTKKTGPENMSMFCDKLRKKNVETK